MTYLGEHVAKRSFQKYEGEDGAACQVLWEAWRHHFKKTGQPCQVPWLVAKFDCSEAGAEERRRTADITDSASLLTLGTVPKRSGSSRASASRPARCSSDPTSSTATPAKIIVKPSTKAAAKRARAADEPAPQKRSRRGLQISVGSGHPSKTASSNNNDDQDSSSTAWAKPRRRRKKMQSNTVSSSSSDSSSSSSGSSDSDGESSST